MTIQTAKSQHYVPQFYLRYFACADEQVYVYDKKTDKDFPAGIHNMAHESYFYDWSTTLNPADAANYQLIENALSNIETKAADLITRVEELALAVQNPTINSKLFLPPKVKENLVGLLILQHLRTKEAREKCREIYTKIGTALMRATAIDVAPDIDPKTLKMQYSEDYIKWQHLDFVFNEGIGLTKELASHITCIGVNNTTVPFWASDHPVVINPQAAQTSTPIDGFSSLRMQIIFPLTKKIALILFERKGFKHLRGWDSRVKLISKSDVQQFNRLQVMQSYRFVFSPDKEIQLARNTCNEFPRIREQDRTRYRFNEGEEKSVVKEILKDITPEEYSDVVKNIRQSQK